MTETAVMRGNALAFVVSRSCARAASRLHRRLRHRYRRCATFATSRSWDQDRSFVRREPDGSLGSAPIARMLINR